MNAVRAHCVNEIIWAFSYFYPMYQKATDILLLHLWRLYLTQCIRSKITSLRSNARESTRFCVLLWKHLYISVVFFFFFFFPLADLVKLAGLLLMSLAAWYLGYLFAALVSEETITSIANLKDIGKKPVLRGV